MTCKDFYVLVGGNYAEAVSRFMSEENVLHFIPKFLSDESFLLLEKGMTEKDINIAFRAAHTLNGIAQSFAFTDLGKSASELTEVLRKNTFDGAGELFVTVKSDYVKVIDAIKQFLKSQNEEK